MVLLWPLLLIKGYNVQQFMTALLLSARVRKSWTWACNHPDISARTVVELPVDILNAHSQLFRSQSELLLAKWLETNVLLMIYVFCTQDRLQSRRSKVHN